MTANKYERFQKELKNLRATHNVKQLKTFLQKAEADFPDDAFVLSEVADTYYNCEVAEYGKALRCAHRAFTLLPDDPLMMYRYGCALYYTDNLSRAADLFNSIMNYPVEIIAYGPYGEGLNYARSIHNDARFMLGVTYLDIGSPELALHWLTLHISYRRRGVYSDFNRRAVVQLVNNLSEQTAQ